jgi:hypothetical protein
LAAIAPEGVSASEMEPAGGIYACPVVLVLVPQVRSATRRAAMHFAVAAGREVAIAGGLIAIGCCLVATGRGLIAVRRGLISIRERPIAISRRL